MDRINGKFEEFVIEWRKYFIDTFKPQHMPKGWDINHRIARSFGMLSAFNK